MSGDVWLERAVKYRVEDVKGATTHFGQVASILARLEGGDKMTAVQQILLGRRELTALQRLASGDLTFSEYLPLAEQEQAARIAAVKEAECRERERVEREWQAIEQRREAESRECLNDPRYRARVRGNNLRKRYGLDAFIASDDFPRLMRLVKILDAGSQIKPEDFAWLSTCGDENYDCYLTEELSSRYHEIEAWALVAAFKRTGDPWQAVNASSHFRKCGQPKEAEGLLGGIALSRVQGAKLKSALCTTLGGAKRDLKDFGGAFELGGQAHALTPRDFRPCTLLGAVCYERGDCEQGRAWYEKAVERGFDEAAVDGELKSIFWRLDPEKQAEMRAHLLGVDPVRYKWAVLNVKSTRRAATGGAP